MARDQMSYGRRMFEAEWLECDYPSSPIRHTCNFKEDDDECMACSVRDCPSGEPLHYHHNGCPCCDTRGVSHCFDPDPRRI